MSRKAAQKRAGLGSMYVAGWEGAGVWSGNESSSIFRFR
jgi:hypothetical protein